MSASRALRGTHIQPEEDEAPREYRGPSERMHPWAQPRGHRLYKDLRDCRSCTRARECHERRHAGLGFAFEDCERYVGRRSKSATG
jgi:hypothetical protein